MNKSVYKYDEEKRAEHMAVRSSVGWYYWTHCLVEVEGPDAAKFLDYLYVCPIANLGLGRARYTTMVDEEGRIWDDVVIFRLAEDKFWISTLYVLRLIPWMTKHKGDFNVEFKDVTPEWHMFAVQGPKSKDLMEEILDTSAADMKFFEIRDNTINGISVKIARAGFSGEKMGFEIYVGPDSFRVIDKLLREKAKLYGGREVREFQVMVWTLPTEKGFVLMSDIGRLTPFEAGMAGGIKWDRDFIGKEALEKLKDQPLERKLMGIILDEDDVHIEDRAKGGPGHEVYLESGEEVGRVAKVTYGYSCEKTIGYIIVNPQKVKAGDRVVMNGFKATVTETSFI